MQEAELGSSTDQKTQSLRTQDPVSSALDYGRCLQRTRMSPQYFKSCFGPLEIMKALTIHPSAASPSSPPKVITGDMQAQYRNRKARHCKLSASRQSLQYQGAFRLPSSSKPPNSLQRQGGQASNAVPLPQGHKQNTPESTSDVLSDILASASPQARHFGTGTLCYNQGYDVWEN